MFDLGIIEVERTAHGWWIYFDTTTPVAIAMGLAAACKFIYD